MLCEDFFPIICSLLLTKHHQKTNNAKLTEEDMSLTLYLAPSINQNDLVWSSFLQGKGTASLFLAAGKLHTPSRVLLEYSPTLQQKAHKEETIVLQQMLQ